MMDKGLAARTAPEAVPIKLEEPKEFFERFNEIYEGIARRAFEIFESTGKEPGHDLDDWFKAESQLLQPVKVSTADGGGTLLVEAEVPGFEVKDLHVTLDPRKLTIVGKREIKEEQAKGKEIVREQSASQILRVIELPAEVDPSKAAATLKNGMLQLRAPKAAAAATSKVLEIKAA